MRRFALVATVVLASCGGGDSSDPTTPAPEPPASESRGVVLSLDPDSPHPGETMTLTVENRTRWRLEYGVPYKLERRESNRWRWVNRDSAFVLPLRFVGAGKREHEDIRVPEHLDPGRYRIVKSFTAPATDRRLEGSVEFTVASR
jgi:Big-like domain-containing protein